MDSRIVITLADGAKDDELVILDEHGDTIEVVCALLARALVVKTKEMRDLGTPECPLEGQRRLVGFAAVINTLGEVGFRHPAEWVAAAMELVHDRFPAADDPAAY